MDSKEPKCTNCLVVGKVDQVLKLAEALRREVRAEGLVGSLLARALVTRLRALRKELGE